VHRLHLPASLCRTHAHACSTDPVAIAIITGLVQHVAASAARIHWRGVKRPHSAGGILMRRPSFGAICLALIPFLAICFSVSAWDRVSPMILGLPFNFFWLLLWIVLTSVCMWGVYSLEAPRIAEKEKRRQPRSRPE
jgi:Protein of unknown function (DUF3311)